MPILHGLSGPFLESRTSPPLDCRLPLARVSSTFRPVRLLPLMLLPWMASGCQGAGGRPSDLLPKGSDPFGNPQIDPVPREEVPQFYADFWMKPSEVNHGQTINDYWMEQSRGRSGMTEVEAFGPYRSLEGSGTQARGVGLDAPATMTVVHPNTPLPFALSNTRAPAIRQPGLHPDDASGHLGGDVYRLSPTLTATSESDPTKVASATAHLER